MAAALGTAVLAPQAAFAQTEVVEYYATDAIGSIRVVFDAAGTPVSRSDYLPFGEAFGTTGNLPAQRFTGQERDGEAGQDNFNARAFAARLGRFTRTDPIGGSIRQPQSLNRYAYVFNNPLTFTDPTGMLADAHPSCYYPHHGDRCRDTNPWNDPGGGFPDVFGPGGFPYGGGEPDGGIGVNVGNPGDPPQSPTTTPTPTPTPTPEPPPAPPKPPQPPGPKSDDPCAAAYNPLFAGKITSNIAASWTMGRLFDVAEVGAFPSGGALGVAGLRLADFISVVAPGTRGDFVGPEKAVKHRPRDVQGAQDAGNFAFYHVGSNYGYSMPFLRAGSVVAAFAFRGDRTISKVIRDEIRDQLVIGIASRCRPQ